MTRTGAAGPRGDKVRSDCHVAVELGERGGIQIELQSRVESMYGRRIRALAADVLESLGVQHASLRVEDQGALDWVLAARMECALRRAGWQCDTDYLPPERPEARLSTTRERLRRSRLYLPGNNPKLMINAGLYGGDALILDLEDSVAPGEKDAARLLVRNALCQLDFGGAERMVRINQGDLGLVDLDAILERNVHVVLVPKVEQALDLQRIEAHLVDRLGEAHGVLLMPIIESARGAFNALDIATATTSVVALAIGLEDYTADLGAQRTLEGKESFWARAQVVNAARAAGVQPIDTVFSDVGDEAGLRQGVLEARALGFEGKGCIHPRQIRVVHEAFAPSAVEVERAVKIVRAFEEAERLGLGVVALGSKMIDPPVVKRALQCVALAEATGGLDPSWREVQP